MSIKKIEKLNKAGNEIEEFVMLDKDGNGGAYGKAITSVVVKYKSGEEFTITPVELTSIKSSFNMETDGID